MSRIPDVEAGVGHGQLVGLIGIHPQRACPAKGWSDADGDGGDGWRPLPNLGGCQQQDPPPNDPRSRANRANLLFVEEKSLATTHFLAWRDGKPSRSSSFGFWGRTTSESNSY